MILEWSNLQLRWLFSTQLTSSIHPFPACPESCLLGDSKPSRSKHVPYFLCRQRGFQEIK